MKLEKLLEEVAAHLSKRIPDLQGLYLFGSFGTAFEQHESDVDLAFLAERPLDPVKTWEIGEEIASKLRRNVDLIDLRLASTILCFQVITTGKRFYSPSANACDWFETTALSSYFHFKEDRKRIMGND